MGFIHPLAFCVSKKIKSAKTKKVKLFQIHFENVPAIFKTFHSMVALIFAILIREH